MTERIFLVQLLATGTRQTVVFAGKKTDVQF